MDGKGDYVCINDVALPYKKFLFCISFFPPLYPLLYNGRDTGEVHLVTATQLLAFFTHAEGRRPIFISQACVDT